MVQIGPGRAGGLTVRVLASPAGEGESPFPLPVPPSEWLRIRADLCPRRHPDGDPRMPVPLAPEKVGEELFRALFADQVGVLFAKSRGAILPAGGGLRLRLRFRLDPADSNLAFLSGLPWELLFDPDARDFLALSRRTPVVRFLEVPRPLPSLPLPARLRILVLMAETPGRPLDLRRERRHLNEAWEGVAGVEIVDLPQAGIANLRDALLATPIHILHLMGHGEVDPATGAGTLLLAGADGSPTPVTGETLAHVLKDFPTLRLVFLNACDTGWHPAGEELDPFTGMATALVLGGVPAVVAMQLPVADDVAIAFSRKVYEQLARGDPLDAAVTEGRHAIHALDPESAEWAIPVLFTRSPDGWIFAREVPRRRSEDVGIPLERRKRVWADRPLRFLSARGLLAGALLLLLAGLGWLSQKRLEAPAVIERIRLSGFAIGRFEVSNREFLRFVERSPRWRRDRVPPHLRDRDYLKLWTSPTSYPPGLDDHPVTYVPWHASRAYCRWAGGDLPTQSEWQKAAHSSESLYPWDSSKLTGSARLNYCDSACRGPQRSANPEAPEQNDGFPGTSPVAAFPQGQTREGVANLSGNVWEWCLDTSNGESVTMGGSYAATFEECTTDTPAWEPAKLSAADGGFRCVWH